MSETTSAPRWIAGIEPPKELLTANGAQILELECRQQPERLREIISACSKDEEVRSELKTLCNLAKAKGPVMFIGMGGSLCSAISGSVMLQSHGRSSFSVDAGEWLHYGASVWQDAAVSILLTTSGESAELVDLFKRMGGERLGLICNNTASTCWKLAQHKLPILAGPEYGNATKTYTNSTAASIILASEMLSYPWEGDAMRALEVFAGSLNRIFGMRRQMEEFWRGSANTEVIGRGSAYGAAIMGALTIREMSGHRAAPHTGAGFKHGPNLDADASHLAVIFALGRAAGLGVKLAQECNRRGGKVILVSSEDHTSSDRLLPVKVDAVPEPWESVTSILVAQALTLGIVEKVGCRMPPRFQYGVMEE
ncbi:MAG TPA: SIS domain-containing protein [Acidobacteriaceae bacterium]|nr:SIS domain-containing protein [Acidobacteriaceae bacterium]